MRLLVALAITLVFGLLVAWYMDRGELEDYIRYQAEFIGHLVERIELQETTLAEFAEVDS